MLLKSLILFLIANQSAKAESQESLIESYIENALYKLQKAMKLGLDNLWVMDPVKGPGETIKSFDKIPRYQKSIT